MLKFIYDSDIINSVISIIYCTTNNSDIGTSACKLIDNDYFNSNDKSFLVDELKSNNLFYLVFEPTEHSWFFYHANKNWDDSENASRLMRSYVKILISSKIINIDLKYFGIVKNDVIIKFIGTINKNFNYYNINTDLVKFVDFFSSNIIEDFDYEFPVVDDPKKSDFYGITNLDMYPPWICVNIKFDSYFDFIFSTIQMSKNSNHLKKLVDVLILDECHNTQPWMNELLRKIIILQESSPTSAYGEIFQLMKSRDDSYFWKKMQMFQQKVIDMFNQVKSIETNNDAVSMVTYFISCFKMDLASELSTVYQRLRHYPKERIQLYKTFSTHPYVKLLKLVHQHYLEKKNKICADEVYCFLSQIDHSATNELTLIIKEAMRYRSELFVPAYQLFSDSLENKIKPKYQTKHNYYPFKIFSSALFFMEHMLRSSDDN